MENAISNAIGSLGPGLGIGLAVIGAGIGIGLATSAALNGSARQPNASGTLRTLMIIGAALIEGLGLIAVVVCYLIANSALG